MGEQEKQDPGKWGIQEKGEQGKGDSWKKRDPGKWEILEKGGSRGRGREREKRKKEDPGKGGSVGKGQIPGFGAVSEPNPRAHPGARQLLGQSQNPKIPKSTRLEKISQEPHKGEAIPDYPEHRNLGKRRDKNQPGHA